MKLSKEPFPGLDFDPNLDYCWGCTKLIEKPNFYCEQCKEILDKTRDYNRLPNLEKILK